MILRLVFLCACGSVALLAQQPADDRPRWGFLGGDEQVKLQLIESAEVALVCVYRTQLTQVRPPYALVTLHATVAQAIKGTLKVGETIRVSFATDSLPKEQAERFIDEVARKNEGALKIVFLGEGKGGEFNVDWTEVAGFSDDLLAIIRASTGPKVQKP